jgi:4-alpha-glucanotransferase
LVERGRSAGILLHPTSLASGRIDEEAYRFVDWLAAAGQSWWSILPLGPPDEHGSPYAARSAFAVWNGLLAEPDAPVSSREIEDFVAAHPYWIGDWAAFEHGDAIADQVRFAREWSRLRDYAHSKRVRIIGDLPIYVAAGGADHAAHPELFQPKAVAGAPPDDFSATGQLWGNPLYDWRAHRVSGYRWWTERFRRTFELVDVTRIDHFRAFVAYWSVPAGRKTAKSGTWRRGPGVELFRAVEHELGPLPLVAEDLGKVTQEVFDLRDEIGIPGMAVMIFGFDGPASNPHRLANHLERQVVYTATHDMETARGWYEAAPQHVKDATGFDPDEPHWGLIDATYSSRARIALAQAQDVLGLGSEARMNYPGRAEGNWSWRLEPGQLTDELAARLRATAAKHRR